MAVSFQLKPQKGRKRPQVEPQGEPVEHIGENAPAEPQPKPQEPQWLERPHLSLENQLKVLPDPPADSDYDAVPIDAFFDRALARISGSKDESRKRPRSEY